MKLLCILCNKPMECYVLLIILISTVAAKFSSRGYLGRERFRLPSRRDYEYEDFDSSLERELYLTRLRDPEFYDKDYGYNSLPAAAKKELKRVTTPKVSGMLKYVNFGVLQKLLWLLLPTILIPFIVIPVKLFIGFKMLVAGKMAILSALLAKLLSKPKIYKKHFKKGKKCKGGLLAVLPIVLVGLLLGSVLSGIISGLVSGVITSIITLVNSTITNSTSTNSTSTNNTNNRTNNGNNGNNGGKKPLRVYEIPEMSYLNKRYSNHGLEKYVQKANHSRSNVCLLKTDDFRDMTKNEIRILMQLLERRYSKEPWVTCSVRE